MDLTGNERMQQRPIAHLVDCLTAMGGRIEYLKTPGCLPLRVYGGGLSGGVIPLESSISSQFASAVLMVAPLCRSPVTLVLSESMPTSLPYILMTAKSMLQFGVTVSIEAHNKFHVITTPYSAPSEYSVEPDASSASFAAALSAITGIQVTLLGIGSSSSQGVGPLFLGDLCVTKCERGPAFLAGDSGFPRVLGRMGCTVHQFEESTIIQGPVERLSVCCVMKMPYTHLESLRLCTTGC